MPTYDAGDFVRSYDTPSSHLTDEPYRDEFHRDYARVIHSSALRRLQGKTQLFPTLESDFFRSRLTHSLEVQQIATSLTRQVHHIEPRFKDDPIRAELVSLAALAHDLGHPPFGHNGEEALDEKMRAYGGFEGNAQTLHILHRLEKKYCSDESEPVGVLDSEDQRYGLGLCYRSYAAILKYDKRIPRSLGDHHASPMKGYYACDSALVDSLRSNVGTNSDGSVFTIECSIMDLADDIAYSLYDLEDALKGNFITTFDLLSPTPAIRETVAELMRKKPLYSSITETEVGQALYELFADYLVGPDNITLPNNIDTKDSTELAYQVGEIYRTFSNLAGNGYFRTQFTSRMVGYLIRDILVNYDETRPKFSTVSFPADKALQVEVLKKFTYAALILSPRFRVVAHRSKEIVRSIFDTLARSDRYNEGPDLLPPDVREVYYAFEDDSDRKRVICDYIAGMTDRYALEFYGRIASDTPQTIFKPF